MGILSSFSDAVRSFWKKSSSAQDSENAVKIGYRRPFEHDITEDIKINGELTRGLFHNSYPGFKLGGALAYAPIAVPVAFMGAPIPKIEDNEAAQQALTEFQEQTVGQCYMIAEAAHRDGTIWVWPYYSAKERRVYWELILDDQVTDIIKDPDTGELLEIVIDENVTYRSGEQTVSTVNRVRKFTRTGKPGCGSLTSAVAGMCLESCPYRLPTCPT